jgi:hypothetical protein
MASVFSCTVDTTPSLTISESHPRLILSKDDISTMRHNALSGKEPYASCYTALSEQAESVLEGTWTPSVYTGDDGYGFYGNCQRDGGMALDLAILWLITRNESFAEAAVRILEAWTDLDEYPGVRINDSTDGGNGGMLASRGIFPFLYAYDLLMTDRKVPEGICTRFEGWLRALVPVIKEGEHRWKFNNYYDRQYFQNHLAATAVGLFSIAIILRDEDLMQYAFDSRSNERDILDMVQGAILMQGDEPYYREPEGYPVHDGEIYDRYRHFSMGGHYKDYVTKPDRGLQYCNLTGSLLVIAAEICRNNGFDLYGWTGENGERIPLVWDHYARYYASHDCSGSIYSGEEWYINFNDEATSAFWEVANARFPHNPDYEAVLTANDRTKYNRMHLFGPVVLTHGRDIK